MSAMKYKYMYHYCAMIALDNSGTIAYTHGFLGADRPMDNFDDTEQFVYDVKKAVEKKHKSFESITMLSISLLNR